MLITRCFHSFILFEKILEKHIRPQNFQKYSVTIFRRNGQKSGARSHWEDSDRYFLTPRKAQKPRFWASQSLDFFSFPLDVEKGLSIRTLIRVPALLLQLFGRPFLGFLSEGLFRKSQLFKIPTFFRQKYFVNFWTRDPALHYQHTI